MSSVEGTGKQQPHAVLLPFPAQGHINPFMQLARLLHSKGFHITFVNTEYNHRRLVRSRGPQAVKGLSDFHFQTIPDGLPPSDKDATQDPATIVSALQTNGLKPFVELLNRLTSSPQHPPPVTCIVSDGVANFGIEAAQLLDIPHATFWTASACGMMGYLQYGELVTRGIFPLKDVNLTDGSLERPLEWITGMSTEIRLRDLPSFATSTDPEDVLFHVLKSETESCFKSNAIIFNTFDALEEPALAAIRNKFPNQIYTIGPHHLLGNETAETNLESGSISSNLWKEDLKCMEWLDQREPQSVVYVNYGSVTVMSDEHLKEFAWGLANSKRPFLWIVRGDIVMGESGFLPSEFLEEVKDRGYLGSWCMQQQVLSHPSVGVFLTHCGWNSMMESVAAGVPMICWPFFAEQQTNCRFACNVWGIGMELGHDVRRGEVADVIREMMDGEQGKVMKQKAVEWESKARDAVGVDGSSLNNFARLIKDYMN